MAKRGKKSWESLADGPMPVHEIAARTGYSVRSIDSYLKSARAKLVKHPEALADLIYCFRSRNEPQSVPACGSVECLPAYRQPCYGPTDEKDPDC